MNEVRGKFWTGVLLIFGTYYYFLIFAQFAFLNLVNESHPTEATLRVVMGMMAVGGLAGSFVLPLLPERFGKSVLLRIAFAGCAATLGVNWVPAGAYFSVAFFIGLFLGVATVGIASSLRAFFGRRNWALGTALGTGLAYTAVNIPLIFQANARMQAFTAAVVSLFCVFLVPSLEPKISLEQRVPSGMPDTVGGGRFGGAGMFAATWPVPVRFWILYFVLFFGILVWFDSAAFYIIQHSELKEGTWGDAAALWRNAFVHLGGAITAGLLLTRTGFSPILAVSFGLLGISALAANHAETRYLTGWLYPAGVSLYSTCLVAFPAYGSASAHGRAITWVASLVFALSGWVCSGLGIGMAQNLRHVPWLFVLAAALLLGAPILVRWFYGARREFAYASLVFVTALSWPIFTRAVPEPQDRIARGRAVYISEGCINCHSQYVKPGSRDELLWGPVRPIENSLQEAPPLFGNRRQGPDLMNVGNRRSRDWLKAHFISPRVLSKGSSMPSYEYLFSDDRGEALVEYLLSLGAGESRWDLIQNWSLGTTNDGSIPASHGRDLFRQHCAMCHGQVSGSPGAMANAFRKAPPDLAQGPFTFAPPALPAPLRQAVLARIIKFGLPGTDMPGREYLADRDLFALMQYVEQCSQKR